MATARVMTIRAAGEEMERVETVDVQQYRKRTANMLLRYFHGSVELGRLPAPLGKGMGFLRGKCSSTKLSSFENTIVFVIDVERCVKRLDEFEQALVYRIAMQDYSAEEAAEVLRCCKKTVLRRYQEALDSLTAMFLQRELMRPMKQRTKICQEGRNGVFNASC